MTAPQAADDPIPEALEELVLELLEGPPGCFLEDLRELLRYYPDAAPHVRAWLVELMPEDA